MADKKKRKQPAGITGASKDPFFENSPVITFILDEKRRVMAANRAARVYSKKCGRPGPGRRCGEYIGCLNAGAVKKGCGHGVKCKDCPAGSAFENITGSGKNIIKEKMEMFFYMNGRKTCRIFLVSASVINIEKRKYTIVSFEDATEYETQKEEIKEQQEFFRSITDSMREIIIMFGNKRGFPVLYMNNAAEKLFGQKAPSEVSGNGLKYKDIIWKKQKSIRDSLVSAGKGEILSAHSPFYTHSASGRRLIKDIFMPIRKYDGSIKEILVIIKDLTFEKKMQESLEKSEKKYRTLVEHLNEGVWQIDKNARTVYVNGIMADMLGYTEKEMQGKHLFEFMDKRGRKKAELNLKKRKKGVREYHEFEFRKKDGSLLCALLHTSDIRGRDGKYAGAIAGVMDITRKKKMEQELRESELKFRTLFNSGADALFVHEIKKNGKPGKFVIVNDVMIKRCGYSEKQLLSMNVSEIAEPGFLNRAENARIMRDFRKNGSAVFEQRIKCADNRIKPAEITITRIFLQGKEYAMAVCKDITERIEKDNLLMVSERKYRELFEYMPSAFALHRIITDKKGKPVDYEFVEVNRAFEMMTGLKGSNVIGKRVTRVLPGIEKDPAEWIKNHGRVALTGKNWNTRNYSQAIGKWFAVKAYSPQKGYFITIFDDITKLKKMEIELEKSEEKYRTVADHTRDWEYWLRPDNTLAYVSPSCARITG
ncbi:MAG: PAS domain S-box protein, partial [bacterium]